MTFTITVRDDFFDMTLRGKFDGITEEEAILEARDFYAHELDTHPDAVNIVNIKREGV